MPRFGFLLSLFAKSIGLVTLVVFGLCGLSTRVCAYVLEGKSWPPGAVVIMELGLGSAGRTLQDGNTSWDDAVLPVAGTWNQVVGRVRITNSLNPQAPVTSGDRVNAVVFSNSIFGQSFGSGTLAVTYY